MVHQHQRRHRFDHWYSPRKHTRIVSAPSFQRSVLKIGINRILLAHHSSHRFERYPKIDRLAVGNATLDSPGSVRGGDHLAIFRAKRVVMFGALHEDTVESRPDIETLGSRQTEHPFGKVRFKTIEDRFSPANGNA